MSKFLPDNYEEFEKEQVEKQSTAGGYMKFKEGENKFRILTQPVVGLMYWTTPTGNIVERGTPAQKGNKPVRIPMERANEVPKEASEHSSIFWAMQVWNYDEEKAQILELTQSTIRRPINKYGKDKDYGDPKGYDIVVDRTEGEITSYDVRPKPPKKFDAKGKDIPNINLNALFEGEDPYTHEVEDESIDVDDLLKEMENV